MRATEIPITGYLDRFSHRPGETFVAHVSAREPGSYRTRLMRVISADPNPRGPGMRFQDLSHLFDQSHEGRRQEVRLGSYGIIETGPAREPRVAYTWTLLVQPGVLDPSAAVLAEEAGDHAIILSIGQSGAEASIAWPDGSLKLVTKMPLKPKAWYRLWLTIDPTSGRVMLGQQPLDNGEPVAVDGHAAGVSLPSSGTVLFAAERAIAPQRHFTGKLEDPAILRGCVEAFSNPLADVDQLGSELLAAWDFSQGIDSSRVVDVGPGKHHGLLVNQPMRAVVGAKWSGREVCWRHAPRDYAAIHFHDDDLEDSQWQPSFTWTVPEDMPSGAYAFQLTCRAGEDWLPFYILPKREGPFAPIAFLAPTFTYQAYANDRRSGADAAYHQRVRDWGAYPHNPDQHWEYGGSTYNLHRDGSGIAFTSRRRPILTMRPGFLSINDKRGSGLRHYPADTHILAWLEAKGFPFDVVTDEDLDDEGTALLTPYRAVLTGSHPEYHTLGTLDALQAYTENGGRLAYLGGNGFYWRLARDKNIPHLLELRRAEGGIRLWAAEPGEYFHALDGQLGGLWRRNRRPPQMLVGVGFVGQGEFEGTHFRRLPTSRDPAHAWIFEGVEEDVFGDYGLSGGGAAGYEFDRSDPALGTPQNAVILARSEDEPASVELVPEELIVRRCTLDGDPPQRVQPQEPQIAAEIVYFDRPEGGAVFSVGSITFCGSLWQNGFDGPVSRILENVVSRFSAPADA
ncbi:N,N-dimethylformamidase beta subunit family domain-containing protein [Mesorhizobium sp. NZP2234]|uniref:N,N-dimethylformamidase beta subunit family domain-containing protein n=1 Tax=Mesorhizobium sp. NZP2234 TaxID=2483402 RepID=UPI001554BB58|nr:N,N-dimethylformamidase beta subunit family domain-containing protein [Mesorhizobium sp. NZP2234]